MSVVQVRRDELKSLTGRTSPPGCSFPCLTDNKEEEISELHLQAAIKPRKDSANPSRQELVLARRGPPDLHTSLLKKDKAAA